MSSPTGPGTPAPIPNEETLHDLEAFFKNQELDHVAGATRHTRIKAGDNILTPEATSAHSDALSSLQKISSSGVSDKADELQELKERLAAEDSERGKARLNDRIKDIEKELGKDGKGLLRSHGKALEEAESAKTLLDKERKSVLDKLAKHRDARIEAIENHIDTLDSKTQAAEIKGWEKKRDEVRKQWKRGEQAIKEHFDEKHEALDEAVKDAKETAGKVGKHANLNVDDYLSSKAKAVGTAKAGPVPEGMWERAKASFGMGEHPKVSGGKLAVRSIGTVVGLGALIDGARKIVAPKRNEQGERQDSMFAAVGEAAVGAGTLYLSAVGGAGRFR